MTDSPTYEYALVPVSDTEAARVPLPLAMTETARDAYLAHLPADVLREAERWPITSPAAAALPPDPITPDDGEEIDV